MGGEINLTAGIQIAQLALKHRHNKNQQQRIIVFVGSPVKYEKKTLEAIGRKLKKNSVPLDVIDFGESKDEKSEKLEALVNAMNNNGNNHIVHAPPGPNALSYVVISDGESGFATAGGMSYDEFGVDPNLDPELALALRVSMEEERARQETAAKKAAEEGIGEQGKRDEGASTSHDATMTEATSVPDVQKDDLMDDENALLQQALAMSMNDGGATADANMSDATTEDQGLAFGIPIMMRAQSSHPLDPLSAAEISVAIATVRAAGKTSEVRDSMRFVEVVLFEPEKSIVALADAYFFPPFQPSLVPRTKGGPVIPSKLPPRRARLVVYNKQSNETSVWIVELNEVHAATHGGHHRGKVISFEVVPDVQPPMDAVEYAECEAVVKEYPPFQYAMKRRGIEDMDLVMVDAWCVGYHSESNAPNRRLAKPLIFCRTKSDCAMENGYACPVE